MDHATIGNALSVAVAAHHGQLVPKCSELLQSFLNRSKVARCYRHCLSAITVWFAGECDQRADLLD